MPSVRSSKVVKSALTASTGLASEPYAVSRRNSNSPSIEIESDVTPYLIDGLSKAAQGLYTKMMTQNEEGHIYTQAEMLSLAGTSDLSRLLFLIQEFTNRDVVKMLRQGEELCYQAVKKEEAEKIQSMSKDEAMVYSYIEASGTEGIWTKTIKARTNLHQSVVQRCLKVLESKRFIKNIKSVKNPTRKIYMLYGLQPSIDVTGGPWFTDSELDTEFISSLLATIFRYIATQSFPGENVKTLASKLKPRSLKRKSKLKSYTKTSQLSYPASYSEYPTLSAIHDFVQKSGITTVDLSESDIKALVDVLIYDGKVEIADGGFTFRAIPGAKVNLVAENGIESAEFSRSRAGSVWNSFSEVPCTTCAVSNLCAPNGPVSAEECIYLDEWLVQ
ncbi:RNA polymerase Rpc34 [Lipomyces oligophaga]|uniref:RNA polymerase Rpc34 n=1 Tax=Lipomyces oligophaga TaxID=45792 RepID=UPI0034CE994A